MSSDYDRDGDSDYEYEYEYDHDYHYYCYYYHHWCHHHYSIINTLCQQVGNDIMVLQSSIWIWIGIITQQSPSRLLH